MELYNPCYEQLYQIARSPKYTAVQGAVILLSSGVETSQSLASELVDPRLHTGYGSLNLRVPTSENHSVRNQSQEAFLRKENTKKAAHNGWLLEGKKLWTRVDKTIKKSSRNLHPCHLEPHLRLPLLPSQSFVERLWTRPTPGVGMATNSGPNGPTDLVICMKSSKT